VDTSFFEQPILNSPYARPSRHWELDADGQPTNRVIEMRRDARLLTPIPKPQRRRKSASQNGLHPQEQKYDPIPIINEIRCHVAAWRNLPNPSQWRVTP
jgi:type III restriction enzyme